MDGPWQFRLCGTALSKSIDCEDIELKQLHGVLVKEFALEQQVELSFHYSDEDCKAKRPFQGVFNAEPGNGKIHVHFDPLATDQVPKAVLKFHFDGNTEGVHPSVWVDRKIAVSMFDTFETLTERVRSTIDQKLEQQLGTNGGERFRPKDANSSRRGNKSLRLQFSTTVHSVQDRNQSLNLDRDDPYLNRFADLADLFVNPSISDDVEIGITAAINVSWNDTSPQHHVIERVRKPVKLPVYLRIGESGDRLEGKDQIAVEFAVMARLDVERQRLIDLREVPAWKFGSLSIGDPLAAKQVSFEKKDWKLLPQFEGAESLTQLEKLVLKHGDEDSQVPFLPSMSLNSSTNPSPKRKPPRNVPLLAVRIVNHIPDAAAQRLDLDDMNCQPFVKNHDTPETVEKAIIEAMKEEREYRSVLFDGALKGTWKFELWAMPQEPDTFAMYRFEKTNKLSDFLRTECMESGDRHMYMECHIWPKDRETVKGL